VKEIRRKDRAVEISETMTLLAKGEYGILSTVGDDGQPYGVPLNYVYMNGAIYFHCARVGHKLENIAHNPNVAFCVVARTKVLPAEFSTDYECAMAIGVASEVQGAEWNDALLWLLEKYSPAFMEEGKIEISKNAKVTKVIKIDIDHISGKARR